MKTLVKGTSVELIAKWIKAMEQEIEEHKFFYINSRAPGYLYKSPVNKARLLVMCEIFDIKNEYIKSNCGSKTYTMDDAEKDMVAYLQTMKELLEIK